MNAANPILVLRPATDADCALVFEWANDPVTRRNSFTPEVIDWDVHRAWFDRILNDRDRALYVVLASGVPAGQVRFERCGDREAEMSLSLAAAWRGQGLAARVIRLATEHAAKHIGLDVVHAYVKTGNDASRRAFKRAGYDEQGETERKGFASVHFIARVTDRQ